MERHDPTYYLEIIPKWISKVPTHEQCGACHGTGKRSGFLCMYPEDENQPCDNCNGTGSIPLPLPPKPSIDPAFIWHMGMAFKDFWARQDDIQAAYALKKAHEDSLNSAGL